MNKKTAKQVAIQIPPGLERDPLALGLQSRGIPVTRESWLTADRGSSDESELEPEIVAMLDRMFPDED